MFLLPIQIKKRVSFCRFPLNSPDGRLTQIAFEQFAAGAVTEAADSLLLDLTNPFAGETKMLSDLFKGHFLATDAEEIPDDVPLSFSKG